MLYYSFYWAALLPFAILHPPLQVPVMMGGLHSRIPAIRSSQPLGITPLHQPSVPARVLTLHRCKIMMRLNLLKASRKKQTLTNCQLSINGKSTFFIWCCSRCDLVEGLYLIGLRKVDLQWRWQDGSPYTTYNDWDTFHGEPKPTGNCAFMDQHGWSTASCLMEAQYICEKSSGYSGHDVTRLVVSYYMYQCLTSLSILNLNPQLPALKWNHQPR